MQFEFYFTLNRKTSDHKTLNLNISELLKSELTPSCTNSFNCEDNSLAQIRGRHFHCLERQR